MPPRPRGAGPTSAAGCGGRSATSGLRLDRHKITQRKPRRVGKRERVTPLTSCSSRLALDPNQVYLPRLLTGELNKPSPQDFVTESLSRSLIVAEIIQGYRQCCQRVRDTHAIDI